MKTKGGARASLCYIYILVAVIIATEISTSSVRTERIDDQWDVNGLWHLLPN